MHDILLGVLFLCMVLFPAAIAMRSGSDRDSLTADDHEVRHDFLA